MKKKKKERKITDEIIPTLVASDEKLHYEADSLTERPRGFCNRFNDVADTSIDCIFIVTKSDKLVIFSEEFYQIILHSSLFSFFSSVLCFAL